MISVFLPSVRRPASLAAALDGILSQSFTDCEVLVVYNFAEAETAEVTARYKKHLRLREISSSAGLVECANIALGQAEGEIFIRTDDDAVASPGWLEAIHETFNSDPKIGGVTGPTTIPLAKLEGRDLMKLYGRFKNGSLPWRLIGKIYLEYVMEGRSREVSQWLRSGAFTLGSNFASAQALPGPRYVTNLEACNFAVRTQLLRDIGGFDSAYATGLGDYHEADAALKIKKLGYYLVFNPKASIEHRPSILSIGKARPNSYCRSQNFLRFYFRHIRPNNFGGWCRFLCYLGMLNAYWCWKALVARDAQSLGGVVGTFAGLIKCLPDLASGRSAL